MYDGGKIIVGLIIGLCLLLYPFFYNAGKAAKTPERELTAKAREAKVCVEPKSYMTTQHMKLLDRWRNEVVRFTFRHYDDPLLPTPPLGNPFLTPYCGSHLLNIGHLNHNRSSVTRK